MSQASTAEHPDVRGFDLSVCAQYLLSTHTLTRVDARTNPHCYFEANVATGDQRLAVAGEHAKATLERARRRQAQSPLGIRGALLLDDGLCAARNLLASLVCRRRHDQPG